MANYDEKELLVEYVERQKRVKEIKALLSESQSKLEETANKIIEHLEDSGATATAKYAGLGRITLNAPQLYASFDEDYRAETFDFLRENGMSDVIRETVHHSTLSSFISGLIKDGVAVPSFIKTYYKKKLVFNKT